MGTEERYVDKLAKYILLAAGMAIAAGICWYFRSVLIYILVAVVVSLIGKPVMKQLQKIRIKGHKAPDWFLAAFTLVTLLLLFMAVITMIVPIVSGIVKGISLASIEQSARYIAGPLADFNEFLRQSFPSLGSGFRIEIAAVQELQKMFDPTAFSSLIGSAASALTSFGVGLFSVVFAVRLVRRSKEW